MSGTEQNPYPKCITCGDEMCPQDSRGWEFLAPESSIVLCPKCIEKTQHHRDIVESLKEGQSELLRKEAEIYKALQTLFNFIREPKG